MSYSPPSIGSGGLTVPTYTDIINNLQTAFLGIFGPNCYLGADSPDYQDIAIRALQYSDLNGALVAVYACFSPLTAIGVSLDMLGLLIGTPRKQASPSTATLTITGTVGTVITNGIAQDTSGNLWSLPASVTIGSGGTISVTGTCQTAGTIAANPGAISIIATPTLGWMSITNAAAAVQGQPVEPDSLYRARLTISQALPSITTLAGTAAALVALEGVTRSQVYENPTGTTQSFGFCTTSGTAVTAVTGYPFDSSMDGQPITINGVVYTISSASGASATLGSSAGTQSTPVPFSTAGPALGPAHSITCVVEGGTTTAIAQAIYNNRGIGCLTNGSTSVVVTDPNNGYLSVTISFDILAYLPIYVAMNVHGLTGFSTAILDNISADVVAYLNDLGIGETVVFSSIYGAALEAQPNPLIPAYSIKSLTTGYLSAATTATTVASTNTITVASNTGIADGQVAVGAGIPPNTTVTNVSGSTITLSQNATAGASLVPVSFFTVGTSDIPVNFNAAASSLLADVVITLV